MYSAAIQRYFNEHIHLPYSFFLQPQRFIRHALKKKGAFMATAYNYVEPSEADNDDIIEYLEEDEANRENVDRIKAYLAINGAKQ